MTSRKAKEEACHRPLHEIVSDIVQAFQAAVWLPYEEDYAVLALTAVASYCQAVFQAVPLLLLCGEPGSGKSTAGVTMADLACNGTVVGQTGAAAAARLIHEVKGLVVLDDLESIRAKNSKEGGSYSELEQWLKVSYNRDTAIKVWVDASRGFRVERLNGFGIKVINNTSGADTILGSRMIRIQTRKPPQEVIKQRQSVLPWAPSRLHGLRNELHAWAFDNVGLVADVYKDVCPSVSERTEEIAAPLKVFARICDDPRITEWLGKALARSKKAAFDQEDPEQVIREAATILARQGYRETSPTHVILEAKLLVDSNFGKSFTNEIPEWQEPIWVGKLLHGRDIVDPSAGSRRQRLYGKNLRIQRFSQHFLAEALGGQPVSEPKTGTDFCRGCGGCPYRSLGCDMMARRLEEDEKGARRRTVEH